MMSSDEIRERYLAFFEEHGHLRIPSASLVPSAHDPSALLTVAGMHPLKPYFLGQEAPPASRLTSCQKVFRSVDIDNVGNTARHLTFFEMLGNFSFGDYFKREAIQYAWELSLDVFGFRAEDIWVTVFAGDEELGLGPDEEAIECWLAVGVPRERITTDRGLRILADHARAMTFLLADGVVPSNEDRGYVLRRVMRRAIQQGRALALAPGFLLAYAAGVREIMGRAYPELQEHAA